MADVELCSPHKFFVGVASQLLPRPGRRAAPSSGDRYNVLFVPIYTTALNAGRAFLARLVELGLEI